MIRSVYVMENGKEDLTTNSLNYWCKMYIVDHVLHRTSWMWAIDRLERNIIHWNGLKFLSVRSLCPTPKSGLSVYCLLLGGEPWDLAGREPQRATETHREPYLCPVVVFLRREMLQRWIAGDGAPVELGHSSWWLLGRNWLNTPCWGGNTRDISLLWPSERTLQCFCHRHWQGPSLSLADSFMPGDTYKL